MIFPFRPSKQIERDEARNLFQVGSPGLPNAFEFGFVSLDYSETGSLQDNSFNHHSERFGRSQLFGPVAKEAVGVVHFSVAP